MGKFNSGISIFTDLYASIAELIGHQLSDEEALDSYAMWNTFAGISEKGRDFLLEESVTLSLRHGDFKYIHPTTQKASWIKRLAACNQMR